MTPRVAVAIVSGFLGSGKTTLVRRVLADAQRTGVRMAVVSNEFGALGIDAALIGSGASRMIELAGGCVCCELSNELVDTLEELRRVADPERIVIETSGLALPYEAQLNLYRPPVSSWVGDEACIVVVDALEADAAGEALADQVSGADLLVLNKCDLVDEATLHARESLLRELSPGTPLIRAVHGDIEPALLFPAGPRVARVGPSGQEHDHEAHPHARFVAEEVAAPVGLPVAAMEAWLKERAGFRTKGFARTAEGVRIVQGVGRRLELVEPGTLDVAPELVGRVVTIRPRG
jgi:G3E family GTPase